MSKWITAAVASAFALTAASGFAQGYKKEELSTEQKTEIRDRVERLKSERANAATAKPVEPAKSDVPKSTPKRTSKTLKHKTTPKVAKATPANAPAVTTTAPKL